MRHYMLFTATHPTPKRVLGTTGDRGNTGVRSRLAVIRCALVLLVMGFGALQAPIVRAQTISIGGSGVYTDGNTNGPSIFPLSPTIATDIDLSFQFPSEELACPGCDYGQYFETSYASTFRLSPALDSFFDSHLSAINPNLSTSLINSMSLTGITRVDANRHLTATNAIADVASVYQLSAAPLEVLTDGDFSYKISWMSGMGIGLTDATAPSVLTPFDAEELVSWFNDSTIRLDDALRVDVFAKGSDALSAQYFIEALGSGNGTAFMAPVPEPSTYAMLLAGLGLMGLVMRRRHRALAHL